MHPVDFTCLKWMFRNNLVVEDTEGTKHFFEKQGDVVVWKGMYDQGLPPREWDPLIHIADELHAIGYTQDYTAKLNTHGGKKRTLEFAFANFLVARCITIRFWDDDEWATYFQRWYPR